MSIEREVKLVAPEDLELTEVPSLGRGQRSSPPDLRTLRAVYFDTDDLSLARAGVTVRHRTGEPGPEWTLKLPDDERDPVFSRRELRFDGGAGAVPSEIDDLVTVHRRARPMRPAIELSSDRTTIVVHDEAGTPIIEVADDHVKASKGRGQRQFREIELELRSDDRRARRTLRRIVDSLTERGCNAEPAVPKAVRALGKPAMAPPDVVAADVTRKASLAELVTHSISVSVAQMMRHDPGVRLGDDPEDVHRFRVGTRRLRSDLRTFQEVLDPDWVAVLRDELKWMGGEIGRVRDADVLLERLRVQGDELRSVDANAVHALLRHLADQRERHAAAALDALRSDRYVDLIDRLVRAAHAPRLRPDLDDARARDVVTRLVRRQWRHLRRDVHALSDDPTDAELHGVRKRAKRARYAAEAVTPVVGDKAARFAAAVEDIQTLLGDHQDAVVAEAWLRDAVAEVPHACIAAGQLVARQRSERQQRREEWPDTWEAASRKRLRHWLA